MSGVLRSHRIRDRGKQESCENSRRTTFDHFEEAKSGRTAGPDETNDGEKFTEVQNGGIPDYAGDGGTDPNSGFSRLPIANDQFTLAIRNWKKDVNNTKSSDHTRCFS